jgi:hypothetical protein
MKAIRKRSYLRGRQQDFDYNVKSGIHEGKVRLRIDTGGFHRPGSNKK